MSGESQIARPDAEFARTAEKRKLRVRFFRCISGAPGVSEIRTLIGLNVDVMNAAREMSETKLESDLMCFGLNRAEKCGGWKCLSFRTLHQSANNVTRDKWNRCH